MSYKYKLKQCYKKWVLQLFFREFLPVKIGVNPFTHYITSNRDFLHAIREVFKYDLKMYHGKALHDIDSTSTTSATYPISINEDFYTATITYSMECQTHSKLLDSIDTLLFEHHKAFYTPSRIWLNILYYIGILTVFHTIPLMCLQLVKGV